MYFIQEGTVAIGYNLISNGLNANSLHVVLRQKFSSIIMGNFIDILTNFEKKLGNVDRSADLQTWLAVLTRYTNN